MKTTKVNSTRIAVLSKKTVTGRAVLYAASPNKDFKEGTVEKVITKRVESANRLYGVFFRGDGKKDKSLANLEEGFTWLMMSMEKSFRNNILNAYKSGSEEKIHKCIMEEIAWIQKISHIEKLEADMMKNATNSVKLAEIIREKEKKEAELEEKMERYLYLSDLAEQIAAQ